MKRSTLILAAVVALTACQARPPAAPAGAGFRLGVAQGAGGLRVRLHLPALASYAGKRGLLATLSDVHHLTITVAAANGPQTVTIPRSAFVNGSAEATIADLSPGAVEVTILAYDAANQVIGRDVRQATVSTGGTAQVAAVLRLKPGVTTPRVLDRTPLNGPPAPTAGGLAAQVTIVDGAAAIPLRYHGAYAPPVVDKMGRFASIDADLTGAVWTTWDVENLSEFENSWSIARIKTDGTIQTMVPAIRDFHAKFKRQVGGSRMVAATDEHYNRDLTVFEPTGAIAARSYHADFEGDMVADFSPSASGICFFSDDRYTTRRIFSLLPGGDPSAITPDEATRYPLALAADAVGGMVYLEGIEDAPGDNAEIFVVRRRADGSVAYRRSLYAGPNIYPLFGSIEFAELFEVVLDAAGTAWITFPDHDRVIRVDASGTRLPDVGQPQPVSRLYVDPVGRVWGNPTFPGIVTQFDADARPIAHYALGEDVYGYTMAVTADDHLWIGDGASILHFTLPVP